MIPYYFGKKLFDDLDIINVYITCIINYISIKSLWVSPQKYTEGDLFPHAQNGRLISTGLSHTPV